MKTPSETFSQGNAEIMVSDGMLIRIENTGTTPCDVVVPEITPAGVEINAVDAYTVFGSFGKISLPDSIMNIDHYAFCCACVQEMNWPYCCETIPAHCFDRCRISSLYGHYGVSFIDESAFEQCTIKEFYWPDRCTEIPDRCFYYSRLSKIKNISHVLAIGTKAFDCSNVMNLDLSDSCVQRIGEFAFDAMSKVILPYYCN